MKEGERHLEMPTKKLIKKGGVKNGWNIPSNEVRKSGWKDVYLQPQIDNRSSLAHPLIIILGEECNSL